jgi:PBP4 family serine-type D-alanyl-D-alanine carboxypeptidase
MLISDKLTQIRYSIRFSPVLGFLAMVSSGALASTADYTLDFASEPESLAGAGSCEVRAPSPGGLPWKDYFRLNPALKKLELGIQLAGSDPLLRNASLLMTPASVEKIFVAGAALHHLGSAMRFENGFTGLLDSASGTLHQPRFRISGDPTWANEYYETPVQGSTAQDAGALLGRLQRVIRVLAAHGVRRVQGPIEVESLRPGLAHEPRPEGWKPEWALQCMAQIQTEFQANGNCGVFRMTSPSRFGWVTSGVTVPVRVSVVRSRSRAGVQVVTPVFDSRGRVAGYDLSGTMGSAPVEYSLPVHQGTPWLRNLFLQALKNAAIAYDEVGEQGWWQRSVSSPIEVDLSSVPLIDILRTAVRYSVNGVMDRVFLEIGYALDRPAESVLKEYVGSVVGDPNLMQGIEMNDGSGLSTHDRMRPDTTHAFLSALRDRPEFGDFFSTLAVAGKSGTLQYRTPLIESPHTNGKIFGKTGTLNGVVNLAGYFAPDPSATPEPFVIFTRSGLSAASARSLVDGVVVNFATLNSQRKRLKRIRKH